jgi:hypothetical protein
MISSTYHKPPQGKSILTASAKAGRPNYDGLMKIALISTVFIAACGSFP